MQAMTGVASLGKMLILSHIFLLLRNIPYRHYLRSLTSDSFSIRYIIFIDKCQFSFVNTVSVR